MDPVKVQGVTDWLQPAKVKDVQSFIGFVNFYQRFICDFSKIAHPLHVLTQKLKDWSWGAAKQQAFDVLKSAVTSAPTLAFPSKSGPFRLECDASNFTTGAVLSQQQEDRLFHLIGFMSKSFSNMERNYQIHDKEMLVIMCTLEEWRHFLEGSDQKFKIHTDHKNLSYFREAHKLNCHQAQWSLYLSRFDFILTHKPRRQMGRPDALSRWADHPKGADDNMDFTLLTLEVFKLRVTEAITLEGEEAIFMEQIQQSAQFDNPVVKALKALDVGELCSDEWTHAEGVVLYRGKVYIPDNPQLHHNLVHAHHSAIVAGHPRHWKMLELVSQNYWWPGLSRYVAKFIAGCDACNQTKTFPTQEVGKLIPNKVPDRCWQVISIDMIGELLDSKGYNAILMVVDHLSKQIHAIPTVTSLDSAGVAQLFLEHVWCHHGLLEEVISDRGPAFMSNFSCELAALLGVKLTPSTSYHPQTDGQTECMNQEIEAYLRVFVSHRQDDWADWLPLAEFAYNNKVHAATCQTPFKLNAGQHRSEEHTSELQSHSDLVCRLLLENKNACYHLTHL